MNKNTLKKYIWNLICRSPPNRNAHNTHIAKLYDGDPNDTSFN